MMGKTPRRLTFKERDLLGMLLSQAGFEGAQELAAQVEGTSVIGGLPTVLDLRAPRTSPAAHCEDGPIPVRAFVQPADGVVEGEILVWVKGGYLSAIEFAWYTDIVPTEFPSYEQIRVEN